MYSADRMDLRDIKEVKLVRTQKKKNIKKERKCHESKLGDREEQH